MTTTTTRIYHRFDNDVNWSIAAGDGGGKLAKGEIGIERQTLMGGVTLVYGWLGISEVPTVYRDCPLIFYGTARTGVAGIVFSEPVVYRKPAAAPTAGSSLSWDSENSEWAVDQEVLNLDEYPTADGTVIWDQSLGKFRVGAAVLAVELDGGEYTT